MLKAGTPEKVDMQPIGTGPFKLSQYQKDSRILFTAFPDYWQGKSKLDRLVFTITPDASVRFAKVEKNECQVMPFPNPADLPRMKANKDINLMSKAGLNTGFLAFNTQKPPLDNVKVRQALAMAINKPAIIEAVFHGTGTAAKNLLPRRLECRQRAERLRLRSRKSESAVKGGGVCQRRKHRSVGHARATAV